MVLDGDTLDVLDVGNLWWHGVFEVDVMFRGSTSRRFAFASDRLSGELTRMGKDGHFPVSALVVVDWRDAAPDPIAISHEFSAYAGDVDQTWWINGTDHLLHARHARDKWTFTVLDTSLQATDYWEEPGGARERPAFGCLHGGTVVVGGRHGNIVRRAKVPRDETLTVPDDAVDCRLFDLSLGCVGRVGCRRRAGGDLHMSFDISRNVVIAAFERTRSTIPGAGDLPTRRVWFSTRMLFAGGSRLLRQERVATLVPDTVGYVDNPTTRIQVLDAGTGEVLGKNDTTPLGDVSRLFCEGTAERIVLSGRGAIHLLDLKTLQPRATTSIPFEKYWVF